MDVSLPIRMRKVVKAASVPLLVSQVLFSGSALLWARTEASEKTDRQLISELGSESFEAREAATRELRNRPGAIPALRRATGSPDREVAKRAREILAHFSKEETRRLLAQLASWGENRQIDRVVEAVVRPIVKDEDEACHAVATKLAWNLLQLQQRYYPKCRVSPVLPDGWFPHRVKEAELQRIVAPRPHLQRGGLYFVSGEEVTCQGSPVLSLIVSTGKVEATPSNFGIQRSVIFANGPVDLQRAHHSIIVCDGDCTIRRDMYDCLVVARGQVKCPPYSNNCLIITACEVVDAGERMLKWNMIKQHEPQLLGFADFFDLHREGIDVKAEKEGLRVTAVRPGTTFSRAGLRFGDVVLTVGGEKVTAADAFRRLIRRKLVAEDVATFKVRRGGKTLELAAEWAGSRPQGP